MVTGHWYDTAAHVLALPEPAAAWRSRIKAVEAQRVCGCTPPQKKTSTTLPKVKRAITRLIREATA
jgi:hypothetical protein